MKAALRKIPTRTRRSSGNTPAQKSTRRVVNARTNTPPSVDKKQADSKSKQKATQKGAKSPAIKSNNKSVKAASAQKTKVAQKPGTEIVTRTKSAPRSLRIALKSKYRAVSKNIAKKKKVSKTVTKTIKNVTAQPKVDKSPVRSEVGLLKLNLQGAVESRSSFVQHQQNQQRVRASTPGSPRIVGSVQVIGDLSRTPVKRLTKSPANRRIMSSNSEENGEIGPQSETIDEAIPGTSKDQTDQGSGDDAPKSPDSKKTKGSAAVKSYGWPKQQLRQDKQIEEGEVEADFPSSDEEPEELPPVIVEQNNQQLRKCHKCLLYIPVDDYRLHEKETCEALLLADTDKEYICSECLALFASQKLLVRHKRECPKRSQGISAARVLGSKGVEGLYSVVWKCHCKKNFSSSDELGEHRKICPSAQTYTSTCPICNIRILGGQSALRYHMSQNHSNLFLPDETSSSAMLSSLQGSSPMQVITTQTSDIQGLVKQLSAKHSGANIRVVYPNKLMPQSKSPASTSRREYGEVTVSEHDSSDEVVPEKLEEMARQLEREKLEPRKRRLTPKAQEAADAAAATAVKRSSTPVNATDDPLVKKTRSAVKKQQKAAETSPASTKQIAKPLPQKQIGKKSPRHESDSAKDASEDHGFVIVGEANTENKEDLKKLLMKAKALTKELEEKLAESKGSSPSKKRQAETSDSEQESSPPKMVKAMESATAKTKKTKTVESKQGSELEPPQFHLAASQIKKGRRYAQVTCLDCQTVFGDYVALTNHKRNECAGRSSQTITFGGNIDEAVEALVGEDHNSRPGKRIDVGESYHCTICPARYKLRSQLYEHMRFKHGDVGLKHYLNYHCPYCPRVFLTTRLRQLHKEERHQDITISPGDDFTIKDTETCERCFDVVPTWRMDEHITNCSLTPDMKESNSFCQLCGLLLDNQEQLKDHRQLEHLNALHFRCAQCSRTFGHAIELRCHKVSHHSKFHPKVVKTNIPVIQTKSNGEKSVKIHIRPAEPLSPILKKGPSTPVATSTPKTATTPVKATSSAKLPTGQVIKMAGGAGPLRLSKDQMQALAKGQPIKLVMPKNTNMKDLSFSIPSGDGTTKKFSLAAKTPEAAAPSATSNLVKLGGKVLGKAVLQEVDSKDRMSPRQELAAALGLQPHDPSQPVKPPAQHRPTRLRSGRTIDSKVSDSGQKSNKEQDESPAKSTEVKSTDDENVVQSSKDDQSADATGKSDVEKVEKKSDNLSADLPWNTDDDGSGEPQLEEGEVINSNKPQAGGDLPTLQVLRPVGADKVQCMRCLQVLNNMMEVANHSCNGD